MVSCKSQRKHSKCDPVRHRIYASSQSNFVNEKGTYHCHDSVALCLDLSEFDQTKSLC